MKPSAFLRRAWLLLPVLLLLASCSKLDLTDLFDPKNPPASSLKIDFYTVAGGRTLEKYNTGDLEKPLRSVMLSGLQNGETLLAIDFRPATGQLYGLGSTSRLYVIQEETGMVRMLGAGPFTPALSGTLAGFDFNPAIDRIRVVTGSGQNLVVHPETGAVATTASPISGPAGTMIAAAAYTNNKAGTATTVLYDIDVTADKLYRQDPPNAGTLVEVGDLKLNLSGNGGFDIAPDGKALALFEVHGKSTLFTVDLTNGRTSVLKKLHKDMQFTGLAIPTQPVAYAVTESNQLLIFNPAQPADTVAKTVTGLLNGEKLLGIDFRPANGQLYALGSTSRIYTLNAASGQATLAGTLSIRLSGTSFGFDFNPVVDQIRIVSNRGQNLRFIPATAATAMDMPLNPGTPVTTAAAYTNNQAGATATMLFDIDVKTDRLYQQTPPAAGTLVDKGALGLNVEAANGFDIGGRSGDAYALLTSGTATRLYRINLETGKATATGDFPSMVTGFALGLGF
ncbi:MAG TPA: DUF4394 domain-containing protein [Chitinophagaceae bacterium]|jgi:hypothetical protein|nr:DUF4394 domain-containing protein [Chitinophagaceae bacterium]